MFFARVRWIGRVLDDARIANTSKVGVELTNTLVAFSKHCEEKNHRGDGADRKPLNLGPAEWAILGAIFAAEVSEARDRLSASLGISEEEASVLLATTRESALRIANETMPKVVALLKAT